MVDEKDEKNWEHNALERVALAAITEQRRSRRWGIFFKLVFIAYLGIFLFMLERDRLGEAPLSGRYAALVDLDGVIDNDSKASADNVIAGLRAAFESKNTIGVILRVNSPGGSPVQASYINNEIARLREKYPERPLYAVVVDMCASGCYYVAAAADKIYANESSIVGSIGVLMDGFGFVDIMKKLGIERRLLTAGENKGFLDPFSPMNPKQKRYVEGVLKEIHQQFIDVVKTGRGDALKDNKDIFSGLVWTGVRAKELGLIDDFASPAEVAREVIGVEQIVDFTARENVFDRFAEQLGVAAAKMIGGELMSRGPSLR